MASDLSHKTNGSDGDKAVEVEVEEEWFDIED
jgi:hypothetical protein